MDLRIYLNSLSIDQQKDFAQRCGTSLGYLRKAISVGQHFDARLAVAVERESVGAVTVEELRPDVDWSVLRCSCGAHMTHAVPDEVLPA